jgi:hypothetical protein
MAITYSKYIYSLGCYAQIDGETNVVFKIQWQLNGVDGIFNSSIPCSTDVPYVAGQPFIPYADLTQDQVFSWIDTYTPAEQMAIWKQAIADNIATQKELYRHHYLGNQRYNFVV